MRYYLDTNTLIFILNKDMDNFHRDIQIILDDYANSLFVSSIVVEELFFLLRIEKITLVLKKQNEDTILSIIRNFGIEINFFNENHFRTYTSLQIAPKHKDMNDHLIIAQAISDKITLISSDAKFKEYTSQGLKFIYNKR